MRTPIPRRDLEHEAATGPSQVVEYTLSPEELAEIRAKYPATPRDKKFKPPIEIKTKPKEGLNEMAKFKMSAEEYFAERATGKTLAQIAKEQGVSEVTVYNHMDKWAKEGKVPRQVEEPKPLREKDTEQRPATELMDKAEREIERLTSELEQVKAERSSEVSRLIAERDGMQKDRDQMSQEVSRLTRERGVLAAETQRLNGEVEHWKAHATETLALSGQASEHLQAEIERLTAERDELLSHIAELETEQVPVTATLISDPVNHPAHYTAGAIECIDAIEAATAQLSGKEAYSTGQIIKYVWRWRMKGGAEDLQKARWYLDRLIGATEVAKEA
ncbi:DUF3310 domain-containing protein [Paenibacillus sinensis]|nr:DUF3310 domain-containing protein [Paenibacillus sinensis]